jgi:hypothetical protein
MAVKTAEEIIKIIQDNYLQSQFFSKDNFGYFLDELDEFETVEAYLESLNLPTEYKIVAGRSDTSEFWSVIHFPVEDVYIKITGTYDSYGQYEHDYDDKVTQVFPKQVTQTVYDKQ